VRFAYGYTMADAPDRVRAAVPRHVAYWRGLALDGYLGGPFVDRSGGLITFEAASPEAADALVAGDPFMRDGLLAQQWTKQWAVE
jgi:uncharacterized protein